jgi:uncharacterized membrane protein
LRRAILAVAVAAAFMLPMHAAWAVGGSVTARFNPDTENLHGRVRSSNDECSAAHGSYVAVASRYEAMHATCDRLTSGAVDVM